VMAASTFYRNVHGRSTMSDMADEVDQVDL
jgi:hypothetical protein